MSDNTSIRVAVRVRPLLNNETSRGCKEIIEVVDENNQILIKCLDKDTAYSFNYVLSNKIEETEVYNKCVQPLIGNLFKGYNVTILAYGQTGSGKTHTMGTVYNGEGQMGVIPRAVTDIFNFVKDNFTYDFNITVSFMELYQEVLYDLLSNKPREQCVLDIREDTARGIHIPALTEVEVTSIKEVLDALEKGTAGRATSATAMNAQSSRSHAIFTVGIVMNSKTNSLENKQAKLNLVDLAGSERPKKTLATGNTFKEGVNINKGLLALGNVISCLGDEKTQHGFVPYRDSSLTRLLKDSLGGNSITLMIACVSPADYNLEETISTLRYADRAKKIRNKPVVNQDPKAAEINTLKKTIQQLRLQIVGQGGPVVAPAELINLQKEVFELKTKKRDLNTKLSAALINNTGLHEKIIILQSANDNLNSKLSDIKERYDITFNNITIGIETNNQDMLKENLNSLMDIKNQFVEINLEQKKTEEEINAHNESKHIMKDTPSHSGRDDPEGLEERQEFHAVRQLKLNVQLTEIERELNLKENLARQLITNNQYFVDPQAMAENEAKIAQLEREKEELLQMLKNVGNSGKIAEQRRKKMQDLEQQLVELKKKVQEQNHLIKQKAKAENRITTLNQEIVQMKQYKVKLVRTMREESDKFRQWKLEKEKECIRLKREDVKKANEINRMKVMHSKQQNVFKRRVEEAEAINKRLKQALALKQQAQEARNSGKAERLEPWLKQEFDLYVNLVEAEATLKVLLEDRATLKAQLDEMKNNCATGDNNTTECKSIEEDLELRSVQIQDLQQKLLDSDGESRTKLRFDKFQSMSEAKYGIKFLFTKATEVVKEKVNFQMKLSELQEMHKETFEKLKEAKNGHKEEVTSLQNEYEEKISHLLHQMKGSTDQSLKEEEWTAKIEELVNEKNTLEQKIEKLTNEKNMLEEKLQNIGSTAASVKTPQNSRNTLNVPRGKHENMENVKAVSLSQSGVTSNKRKDDNPSKSGPKQELDIQCLDDSIVEDDIENDPDWRKTPLGKRIIEEKKNLRQTALHFGQKPVKRSSEGGCTCKTNCGGPRCGCRKMDKTCGITCRCNDGLCENRVATDLNEPLRETNEEFKKPRDTIDGEIPIKRSKKNRNIFSLD